jgi:hypothetical protein
MAIKDKEYTFGIDKYNKPNSVEGNQAVGLRLMELITLQPGDDPLHPDMGVGLKDQRYSLNELDSLRKKIEQQIRTYLPFYQSVDIDFKISPEKYINIEINLDNTVYVYNSANTGSPITLSEVGT